MEPSNISLRTISTNSAEDYLTLNGSDAPLTSIPEAIPQPQHITFDKIAIEEQKAYIRHIWHHAAELEQHWQELRAQYESEKRHMTLLKEIQELEEDGTIPIVTRRWQKIPVQQKIPTRYSFKHWLRKHPKILLRWLKFKRWVLYESEGYLNVLYHVATIVIVLTGWSFLALHAMKGMELFARE